MTKFSPAAGIAGMLIAATFAMGLHIGAGWSPAQEAMDEAYKDGYEDGYEAGWQDHAASEWDPPSFDQEPRPTPLPLWVFPTVAMGGMVVLGVLGGVVTPWAREQWGRYAEWVRGEET